MNCPNGEWDVQMEPWTYKRNVGRLRRQRKRSLNLELPKWSVGRPNGTLDAQMEPGTFAQATKTLLKRFYQTPFGLLGFNALRIKMFAAAHISQR